ncbi:MAG: trigger factor [Chitinophagales bacterium]
MNTTQSNSDALNAIISIEIKKEDYLPAVDKALATAKNNAVIKGFRKGFVPIGVVKKMYGNSILLDELNKKVSDALNKHIEGNKIDMLGRPLPLPSDDIQLDINNPSDFTFQYEIGLAPSVDVAIDKSTKVTKNVITIDDKTLDEELDKIAVRYGKVTNEEEVKEGKEPITEKAVLNQELFDKIYGPGAVNSVEEFREKIRAELEGFSVSSTNNQFKENIYNTLMNNTKIDLPDAFLKRFIKSSNEKPVSDEQIETEYPMFVKGLKWNLITDKIVKDNGIKIEMADIKEFSKNALRQQLMMYNPTGQGLPEETIDQLNDSLMSKEEHVKKSYDGVLEQKLFTFIEQQITIDEVAVSFADFFDKKENK